MKILMDTNVILDVLFEREPFVAHSSSIMGRVERRTLNGILCATTLTTIHYLTCKTIGKAKGSAALKKCYNAFFLTL